MSHSYKHSDKLVFHFNQGLQGDLNISIGSIKDFGNGKGLRVEIPCEAILKLVAEYYVKPNRIEELEGWTYKELLR